MGFHVRRPRPVGRRIVSVAICGGLMAGGIAVGVAAVAAPAYASSSTDLTVSLANKVDAKPGKRVSYRVTVHNAGPSTAKKVQAEFVTTAALGSVQYSISTGRCIRSPKETACLFGTLKPGQTETVTISGVMPKKMAKGTSVNNKVTVLSNTHLTNTTNDVATDNYRIGMPRTVAGTSPSPSASTESKITKITNAATAAIKVTHKALLISIAALIAAVVWFVVGLTLKHRRRRRTAALHGE
jgi:hypothetical protein